MGSTPKPVVADETLALVANHPSPLASRGRLLPLLTGGNQYSSRVTTRLWFSTCYRTTSVVAFQISTPALIVCISRPATGRHPLFYMPVARYALTHTGPGSNPTLHLAKISATTHEDLERHKAGGNQPCDDFAFVCPCSPHVAPPLTTHGCI